MPTQRQPRHEHGLQTMVVYSLEQLMEELVELPSEMLTLDNR